MSGVGKISKFIKYNVNDDQMSDGSENDDMLCQKEQDLEDLEYYNDTIENIQNSIISFAIEKSLPMCEYLNKTSIKKFIQSELNL
jgi:hypothetical protein